MTDRQPSLDPDLTRLFDEAHLELPATAFLESFERRIARARGVRLALQVAALGVLAPAALGLAPYAVRGSLLLSRYAMHWAPGLGLAMSSPVGWACSLLLGVWVLRRCHAFER
jgi:hypothetical protein